MYGRPRLGGFWDESRPTQLRQVAITLFWASLLGLFVAGAWLHDLITPE